LATENYSPWAIVWLYLRDPMFSRFDAVPECDGQTDTHTTTAYFALAQCRTVKTQRTADIVVS